MEAEVTPRKELLVSSKHEREDDKRAEKIPENGERPKGEPLPEEDSGETPEDEREVTEPASSLRRMVTDLSGSGELAPDGPSG